MIRQELFPFVTISASVIFYKGYLQSQISKEFFSCRDERSQTECRQQVHLKSSLLTSILKVKKFHKNNCIFDLLQKSEDLAVMCPFISLCSSWELSSSFRWVQFSEFCRPLCFPLPDGHPANSTHLISLVYYIIQTA